MEVDKKSQKKINHNKMPQNETNTSPSIKSKLKESATPDNIEAGIDILIGRLSSKLRGAHLTADQVCVFLSYMKTNHDIRLKLLKLLLPKVANTSGLYSIYSMCIDPAVDYAFLQFVMNLGNKFHFHPYNPTG